MKVNVSAAVPAVPQSVETVHLIRSSCDLHGPVEPPRAGYSPTILLVEDDDDLRLVMTYFLESLRFTVIACADAEAATATFQRIPTVDLLMTDLQMPGRSGLELAFDLAAVKPSLPVLIVSGSILQDRTLTAIRQQGWAFLAKPCKFDSLVSVIHSLLNPIYPLAA